MGRVKKTLKSIMWKVALYIRLSKEDGNETSFSVINQENILRKYVEEIDENFEIYDIYIDDGKTGTDSNRDDFQRMLNDINSKKVNCVIVKDLSRLSRNYSESGAYLEQYFVEKNIRFISLELPKLDSYLRPDEVSSISTAFQNIVNDDFCRQTSIKIRGTFNRKRSDGEFIGAFAPYGYAKDPNNKHHLIIDHNVENVIKDIFNWFLSGESKTGIVKRLNQLGVGCPSIYKQEQGLKYQPTRGQNPKGLWHLKTVDSILRNQVYLGHMVQGKQKVVSYKVHKQVTVPEEEWFVKKDTHQPIIDQATFDKVQALLKRDVKTVNNSSEPHMFAGLLKCADCNMAMHRRKSGKYIYYMCRTYKFQSKTACTPHSIRESDLTKSVLDAINYQLVFVSNLATLLTEIENAPTTKNKVAELNKALLQKEKEKLRITTIRDGLYMDWKNGDITHEDYTRLQKEQNCKLETYKQALISLRKEITTLQNELNTDSPLFETFKKYQQIDHLDRGLLIELIENIYVYENKQIKVKFNFNDQIMSIAELSIPHSDDNIETTNYVKTKKIVH